MFLARATFRSLRNGTCWNLLSGLEAEIWHFSDRYPISSLFFGGGEFLGFDAQNGGFGGRFGVKWIYGCREGLWYSNGV